MTLRPFPVSALQHDDRRAQRSGLTAGGCRPYRARVNQPTRSFYFSGFFYYGFPYAGRDWRRTRE